MTALFQTNIVIGQPLATVHGLPCLGFEASCLVMAGRQLKRGGGSHLGDSEGSHYDSYGTQELCFLTDSDLLLLLLLLLSFMVVHMDLGQLTD